MPRRTRHRTHRRRRTSRRHGGTKSKHTWKSRAINAAKGAAGLAALTGALYYGNKSLRKMKSSSDDKNIKEGLADYIGHFRNSRAKVAIQRRQRNQDSSPTARYKQIYGIGPDNIEQYHGPPV